MITAALMETDDFNIFFYAGGGEILILRNFRFI